MNKPVVLHIVRCYQELFAILKRYSLRVMVHGFNGSPELLNELWKRDITVSFAPQILHKPELLTKLSAPAGKFGFESDNSPDISVKQILSQTGIKNIENMTDQYFNDFLEI
jgi:Tat protein secretion system quality control protein TatD with DNase activity